MYFQGLYSRIVLDDPIGIDRRAEDGFVEGEEPQAGATGEARRDCRVERQRGKMVGKVLKIDNAASGELPSSQNYALINGQVLAPSRVNTFH